MNNLKGKISSLWEMLGEDNSLITIPIIQRDYVQGRSTPRATSVRETFVEKLLDTLLNEDAQPLRLDFIYGTNLGNEFYPFDGQQRLTTLYLLIWYFSLYYTLDDKNELDEIRNRLRKFSYQTRETATDFCRVLSEGFIYDFSYDIDSIKYEIMNSGKFYSSWNNDPTVVSMLTMLDEIHKRFRLKVNYSKDMAQDDIESMIEKAKGAEKKLQDGFIDFYALALDNTINDSTYIKMNARGKELTHYENLKVELIKILEDILDAPSAFIEEFKEKIDGKWTDLFWTYRKRLTRNSNDIDSSMMNFIKFVFDMYYGKNASVSVTNLPDSGFIISNEDDYKYMNNLVKCIKNGELDIKAFEHLRNILDIQYDRLMVNDEQVEEKKIEDANRVYADEVEIFINVCSSDFNNCKDRVIASFHYELLDRYYANRMNDEHLIRDWMRVIVNICEAHYYFTEHYRLREYVGYLRSSVSLIDEIEKNKFDVISFLSKIDSSKEFFGHEKQQTEEEVKKAKIILESRGEHDPSWEEAIYSAEAHAFFNGTISILLKLSYTADSTYNISDFKTYFALICELIDGENIKNEYFFRGALLCFGDYRLETDSGGSKSLVSNQPKYHSYSWRSFFRNGKYTIVKSLLDSYKIEKSLSKVIEKNKGNISKPWMKAIAEDPKVVYACFQRYKNNNLACAEVNEDLRCAWYAPLKATGNAVTVSLMLEEACRKVKESGNIQNFQNYIGSGTVHSESADFMIYYRNGKYIVYEIDPSTKGTNDTIRLDNTANIVDYGCFWAGPELYL
jgi:Protein of unknown function DUF262.